MYGLPEEARTLEGDAFLQHVCAALEELLPVALRPVQGPAGLQLAVIPRAWALESPDGLEYQMSVGWPTVLCGDLGRGPSPHGCESPSWR